MSETRTIERINAAGKWAEIWWEEEPPRERPAGEKWSWHFSTKWWQLEGRLDDAARLHILNHGWVGMRVTIDGDEVVSVEVPKSPQLPIVVDLDGIIDEARNIRYIGKATRRANGRYTALADVGGLLCIVEATVRPTAASSLVLEVGLPA